MKAIVRSRHRLSDGMTSAAALVILFTVILSQTLCFAVSADEPEDIEVINSLFPKAKGFWVGDVMPMTSPDDGKLDLFYLFDKNNNGSSVMHPFHMFSTSDFISYSNEGLFVEPTNDPESQDFLGLGTGCFYSDGDVLHCFYTGVNNVLETTTAIMHAVSSDGGKTWNKLLDETIYPPEGYDRNDYRDAQIEYNEKTGEYMLLVGGRTNTGRGVFGTVIYYTSKDLHSWVFRGNLFAPDRWYMCECPDIQKIGDRYYLFFSWECVTFYAVADEITGPYRLPKDYTLSGDGFTFYAGKAGELDGRYYLCAWLGRKIGTKDTENYEWGGNMVVFEIYAKEDGTLGIDAPHTYRDFFGKKYDFIPVGMTDGASVNGNSVSFSAGDGAEYLDMGLLPGKMMLSCKFSVNSYFSQGGLVFGTNGVGGDSLYIMLNASKNRVEYDALPLKNAASFEDRQGSKVSFGFEPGAEYDLKIVVENEIIALYVNGEKTLINRIYDAPGFDWGFFGSKNGITFSDIEIFLPEDSDAVPGVSSTKRRATPTPHTTTKTPVKPVETTAAPAPISSGAEDTEPEVTEPSGAAGGGLTWVLPAAAGGLAAIALFALGFVLKRKKKSKE
ncbi:MAG: hypothetical protein J6Z80_04925 [Clostridia bacterium]|nr:hypothetical protein [Clostridia bacterium]